MRNLSKKGLAVALCFGFILTLGTAWAQDKEKFEEKFEKTESLAADGKVVLSNVAGDIEIMTWKDARVKIDALKVSRANTQAKAKENAAEVKIEVTKEGSTLRIETKYPKRNKFWEDNSFNVSVDYKLWIPEKASLTLKSVSGDIKVDPIGGKCDINSVSGDVDILGAAGLKVSLVSGDLTVTNVGGDAFLKTVSGDIEASNIQGSVESDSVSGDIDLVDVSGARNVKGNTVSGDITYKGEIMSQGQYRFKSHSGDVEVLLPANAAFEFAAKTFSGSIDSAFEIKVEGQISRREIHGTVGGGGASISLTTFSGNIDLKKR